MKTLQDTPTAELLAEWNELKAKRYLVTDTEGWEGQMTAIAAELDRRCEDAQIAIIDGVFCFHPHPFLGEGKFAKWRWIQHVLGIKKRLLASELRDLLTWLLMKGGNG